MITNLLFAQGIVTWITLLRQANKNARFFRIFEMVINEVVQMCIVEHGTLHSSSWLLKLCNTLVDLPLFL